jgi:hypothetical protein
MSGGASQHCLKFDDFEKPAPAGFFICVEGSKRSAFLSRENRYTSQVNF